MLRCIVESEINALTLTTRWEDIDWGKVSVKIFRLQRQIYTASRCGNVKKVRQLQKLLRLRSWGRRKTGSIKAAHKKYWTTQGNDNWVFATRAGNNPLRLIKHDKIKCSSTSYRKVKGDSSPYDGRAKYWSTRRGEYPETPKRIAKMLQWQRGKCNLCGQHFREEDLIEIDHIRPLAIGGKNEYNNLQLLHRHCHDVKTREDNILINQEQNKKFLKRLHQEWEKVDYIWVDDIPLVLGKSP